MYEQHFGFSESPFSITPDPAFLYLSPTHQEALAHLRYGIEQKKGFIVLTGEVGCGKTILSRTLLDKLDPKRFETILIFNPQMDSNSLLRTILREIGEPCGPSQKSDLLHEIYKAFLDRAQHGKNIILIIDEAQNLSLEVFEQVRLLSNLETDNQKLLQIILMGQPELQAKLNQKQLRQLKQRVLVYYNLSSLNKRETFEYIYHRLNLACPQAPFPQFSYWALSKAHQYSKGIPRVINNLCDKALLSAYTRSSTKVQRIDVMRAIKDIKKLEKI